MTKTFCDICLKENNVTQRHIITRIDIGGKPCGQIMDVCDDCYSKILDAQVEAFQSIRRQAMTKEDI